MIMEKIKAIGNIGGARHRAEQYTIPKDCALLFVVEWIMATQCHL